MTWILRLIPFPFFLFMVGLLCLAITAMFFIAEDSKRQLRESGPPAAVPISQAPTVRGFPWVDEVAVRAQTSDDLTYLYWETTPEGDIEYPIFFFVDPDHTGPVREVLGAFSFTSLDQEDVSAFLERAYTGDGELGPIFEMTGDENTVPAVTMEEVEWALYMLDLKMAENFFYIDPYIQGRDYALQARPHLYIIPCLAGIFLIWLSMIAAIFRRKWMRREADGGAQRKAVKKGLLAAAVGGVGKVLGGDEDEGLI